MTSLCSNRHPSAAAFTQRVTQARLRVLRRIVFAAAQVAALFVDGFLLRTSEAFAAPAAKGGVSCSNCGWWPWNDLCNWVKVRDVRGIAYSDKRPKDFSHWCVSDEQPPEDLSCDCTVQVGTKMYKWIPSKLGFSFSAAPPWPFLKDLGIVAGVEWDLNSTITHADTSRDSFTVMPGSCGPTLYCYTSREYVQSLYKQRLGVPSAPTGYYNGGWGNTGSTPAWTYTFLECNSPCSGDYTVFLGMPTAMIAQTELRAYEKPLQSACQ